MMRGCGKRRPGGLYICSELSPFGVPIENLIIDPPLEHEGKLARAPIIFEKNGINHLLFWVGEEHYPYPSDFIEEARRFGVSKRISISFPIEKLEEGSMMFFIHSKAIIDGYEALPQPEYCPKNNTQHLNNAEHCLGHVYQLAPSTNGSHRQIGDTVYQVYPAEESTTKNLRYKPGIFLRMPVTNIDHVLENGRPNPEIAEKQVRVPLCYTTE